MMNVENMRLVVDVLESTKACPAWAEIAARRWSPEPQPLSYVRSSTTFIFTFYQGDQKRILRLQHSADTTLEQIISELEFIHHVFETGVQAAKAILSRNDEIVEVVDWEGHTFYATTFEYMIGKHCETQDLTSEMLFQWGKTLALIHLASRSFVEPGGFAIPSWENELNQLAKYIPEDESRTQDELKYVREWLGQREKTSKNYGLIHRDLELDNMKWDGEQFLVFDFNDLMYHYFAADVASSLEEVLGTEDAEKNSTRFIEGYERHLGDLEIDVDEFPMFYRAAILRKYLRLLAAYSGTRPESDTEWLSEMRKRHEGVMDYLRESVATPFSWQ